MQGMIDADGSKIYKISWDGTGLKIMASALAWGDTNWQAFISPVTIDRNYTLNYNVLNLWSDALGGQVSIALNCDSNVTGGYNCDAPNGETPVIYYSQETVLPRETIPSLACYENCPKMVNGKLETLSYNGSNSTPVNYNFNDGILEFLLTPNSPQSIPIIDTTVDGVYSGPLFEDNPENVQKLNCLYDGNQFCPWQARSNLDVYYTWSTSIHSWDNLTLIENDSLPGKFVKFDKPMDLNFTYPDTTVGFNPSTTDAKYKGSQFVLQYSSFGNLGNIPGHCIDPNNPGVVINDCSAGGLRWVPEFTIPVGVEVTQTINNKKIYYLIKPLEIEQRLAIADPSSCVGLVTDMTTEFLDIDKAWTDPLLGTEPSKSPLKVVAGVVQTSLRKAASSRE